MINTVSGLRLSIARLSKTIEESKGSARGVNRLVVASRANHRKALKALLK